MKPRVHPPPPSLPIPPPRVMWTPDGWGFVVKTRGPRSRVPGRQASQRAHLFPCLPVCKPSVTWCRAPSYSEQPLRCVGARIELQARGQPGGSGTGSVTTPGRPRKPGRKGRWDWARSGRRWKVSPAQGDSERGKESPWRGAGTARTPADSSRGAAGGQGAEGRWAGPWGSAEDRDRTCLWRKACRAPLLTGDQ